MRIFLNQNSGIFQIDDLCLKVNSNLNDLSRLLIARNLTLSSTKFKVTIFTSLTKEYRLDLNISDDGFKIPTEKSPIILGVTLDRLYCRTQLKKLQTCQNNALRTITGCLLMSIIEYLHSKARMFPIKEHKELLQFLLRQAVLPGFTRFLPGSFY